MELPVEIINKIFDEVNIGIAIIDLKRNILNANKKLAHILGYNLDELIGMNTEILSFPEDDKQSQEGIEKAISNNHLNIEVVKRYIHKTGKIIFCELTITLIPNKRNFIAFIKDVSEKVQQNERLKILNDELEKSNQTKDMLFSIISHDLKGPIGTVHQLIKKFIRDFHSYDDNDRLYILKCIFDNIENSQTLLENLLLWASLHRSKLEIVPVTLNALEFIETNIAQIQTMADAKELCIDFNIPKDVYFHADKFTSSIILRNLLTNAIKFTNRNGNIFIFCDKYHENGKNYIKFHVIDNGIGIPEKKVDTIFDIKKYLVNYGTENEKGSGLGLALCKEFIKKNGGNIWVTSEEGNGSTFSFSFFAH